MNLTEVRPLIAFETDAPDIRLATLEATLLQIEKDVDNNELFNNAE